MYSRTAGMSGKFRIFRRSDVLEVVDIMSDPFTIFRGRKGEEGRMADCGREGGSFSRRRSAKRRERTVRRDRRGVRGGLGGGRVFSGVGVELMETASQLKGSGMFTSAPKRGKILCTDRSLGFGNLASSHAANGTSSGLIGSRIVVFNGGKSD